MYIGLAFNERNDAFDFNTALEDSRREKEVERKLALGMNNMLLGNGNHHINNDGMYKKVDYTMKEGEKIHVSIPKLGRGSDDDDDDDDNQNSLTNNEGGGGGDGFSSPQLLSLSSAATRRRTAKKSPTTTTSSSSSSSLSSNKKGSGTGGGVLKPSSKDTPSRLHE